MSFSVGLMHDRVLWKHQQRRILLQWLFFFLCSSCLCGTTSSQATHHATLCTRCIRNVRPVSVMPSSSISSSTQVSSKRHTSSLPLLEVEPSLTRLPHKTQRPTRHGGQTDTHRVKFVAQPATRPPTRLVSTLLRGAFLRITSDLVGGTAFENIKTRVTTNRHENMVTATANIVRHSGGGSGCAGVQALWSGTSTRCIEGFLVGAVFMLGSTVTKQQLRAVGVPPTLTALAGGLVGGIGQATVMTPAGMVFTNLNVQRSAGNMHVNAWTVSRRIVQEQGWRGMYSGFQPMALRQASNWASRAGLTEVARSVLGLQKYGIMGEIGSGILGGVGSCWNTPIEMVRVLTQRDIGLGQTPKTITGYWRDIYQQDGPTGLFRGITPRAFQAFWQTCFMVVVPNLMGI